LTNLLEDLQNATNILDGNDPVDVVYLDFQKAFDKVPHERLLSKLGAHGVGGSVYVESSYTDSAIASYIFFLSIVLLRHKGITLLLSPRGLAHLINIVRYGLV